VEGTWSAWVDISDVYGAKVTTPFLNFTVKEANFLNSSKRFVNREDPLIKILGKVTQYMCAVMYTCIHQVLHHDQRTSLVDIPVLCVVREYNAIYTFADPAASIFPITIVYIFSDHSQNAV
jgi:hypothetical protein